MSNDTGNNTPTTDNDPSQSETATEQSKQEQSKGREPDYDMIRINENIGRNPDFINVGPLWKSRSSENLIGNTAYGRIMIKPRTPKEGLEEIRQEAKQNPSQTVTKTQTQTP